MIRKMLSCVLIALIASALPIPSSAATSSILAPKQWVLDQLVVSNASDFVTSNTNSIAYKAAHGGGGGGADTNAVKNIVTNTLSTIHINGQQLAENVTITTFSPFKTTWPTGSGINTFFSSVARDADAKDGTAFLGQLSGTSTPWETGNCEATLQVMKNTMGRLIYIVSVYSTDIYPYYWFNMSVSGGPGNGWRCYAPKSTTLSGYGITDAYTKEDIDGNSVTNGGAKAYADATFLPARIERGYRTVYANVIANGGWSFKGDVDIGYQSKFISQSGWNGYTIFEDGQFKTLTSYLDDTFAPKLTGRTYDFDNGSNFTLRVYIALTNVIQTLGGTVANPPTFN